ncbi:hypothetical protein [Bradyrhizobium sp. Cp5.3]|uniref:hypothetical protein n=1 Tax=Bradyrhizobium sp. Cp5.3 TaxID=443598 RepID=UPI0012EC3DD5|nr:hypothetical protein [Bradyrhizobium sp. Cp5.3]
MLEEHLTTADRGERRHAPHNPSVVPEIIDCIRVADERAVVGARPQPDPLRADLFTDTSRASASKHVSRDKRPEVDWQGGINFRILHCGG